MAELTPLLIRRSRWVRVALLLIAVGLLSWAALALRSLDLSDATWLPKCVYHLLTGYHCPGCGITRAVQALLLGNVAQAFAYNAMWPLVVLMVLPYLLRASWYWVLGVRPNATKRRPKLLLALAVFLGMVVVIFGIARNLPGEPWRQLAPHDLP